MKYDGYNGKEMNVQVRDFKMHAKLYGEKKGCPTVIMDAGYGDYSKAWTSIIPEVSKVTEVLVFDRAGLGKSERSAHPRTSIEMVKELKELLLKLNINGPYILVGHSFGGVNARVFASQYPHEVAGLILIDSTPENYKERFLPTMSKEFQEAYYNQFVYEGTYEEFKNSLYQLKETKRNLDIPAIILSAGKKAHYSTHSQELWNEMQKEMLDIFMRSEMIIASNSAHYIQHDEPEVVINSIKRLISKL
ncbi:alpha/beta fold hydrolase [Peribacillus frigoritolerans]|uniref:alpha/beta fold hydrolase n=1 Tax=Peribacillus frigoritolerans TaxID=450367 RepID=UPI0010593C2B|nr:alpha/beta fold hydrolase [Peribacillus frigoritolerans]TDL82722.1 alpha/beta fold hydrolase [Peribacillus frigoritolerans]